MPRHGYHHTVLLTDLPASTTYYYQCGDGAEKRNTSPVISFKTPPGPTETVSMALLGDWGYLDSDQRPMDIGVGGLALNWTATLVRELLEDFKTKDAYSLSFILGDIGYADDSFGHKGETLRFGYEPAYDGFMAWNENITNTIPMMVTPGNHESECHDPYCILRLQDVGLHLNNFSAYNTRWAMPSAESGGVLNMWYSFNWGPVHITSINTETDWAGAGEETTGDSHFKFLPAGGFGADGQYLSWLEADLAAAAADPQVSWIIAAGHRPFEDLPQDHRESLVALFEKYGVAMYFAGHGHTYIRYDVSAWGDNTVHIMPGASGNDETYTPADQFDAPAAHVPASESCMAWCGSAEVAQLNKGQEDPCRHCRIAENVTPVFQTDKMSAGILTASKTELSWKLYRAPDGLLLDSVTVSKK